MARVYQVPYSESGTDLGSVVDDVQTRVASVEKAEEKVPGWVSMSMSIFALMVLFTAVSGVTVYVLSDGTMNRALDSTKSSCKESVDDIVDGFTQLNQDSVHRTLQGFADDVEHRTNAFLSRYVDTARMLRLYTLSYPPTTVLSWDWMSSQHELLFAVHRTYQPQGFGGVSLVNNASMLHMLLEDTPTTVLASNGSLVYGGPAQTYTPDLTGMATININVSSLILTQVGRVLPANRSVWTPITGQVSYYGSFLVSTIRSTTGEWVCSVAILSDLRYMSTILKESISSLANSTRGRAWAVVQSDIVNKNTAAERVPRMLAGVSHGACTYDQAEYDPVSASMRNVTHPLDDQNATDPVIRSIATLVGGNYFEYAHLSLKLDGEVPVYILAKRWVDTNPEDGLWMGTDWWFAFVIERDFYMSALSGLQEDTSTNLGTQESSVNSKIQSDRRILIYVTVAIMVILSIGCYVLALTITNPLNTLKEEMGYVADMNLEKVDTRSLSKFKEVAAMQDSFVKMIQKLTEFRSFVPASLLVNGEVVGGAAAEPPTGDCITFVFTDIQGSTALWAHSQEAMNTAMDIHNDTIRTALHFFGGYEVKTIGDAFMIAFCDCVNAMSFCLSVQRDLLDQDWPEGLGLEKVDSNGKPLWNGLRIRMGVHCGSAIVEENPITARTDYRGENVAKASRAENMAKGGTVCITSTLLEKIQPHLSELDHPAILDIGEKQLKGIQGTTALHILAPRTLADRLKDDMAQVQIHSSSVAPKILKRGNKTALRLVNKVLTLGIIKVWQGGSLMSFVNQVIRVATDLARETGGAVSMVWGTELLVTWNAMTECPNHAANAARFAVGLTRKIRSGVTVGLVTGKTLHGNVGTSKTRFPAVMGRNLKIASALTDYANGMSTPVLMADTSNEKTMEMDPMRDVVRAIDRWHITTHESRVVVTVYEVMGVVLQRQMDGVEWFGTGNGGQQKLACGTPYTTAFHQALKGDLSGMEKLRDQHPSDTTLGSICSLLRHARYDPSGTRQAFFTTLPYFGNSSVSAHLFGAGHATPTDISTLQPEMSYIVDSTPQESSTSDANSMCSPLRETSSNF
eukprot:TRINITY_DN6336_c0_g4_i1.p1 TRINITY_DN6336_c0_g4~~TRINITY_DN6336_c0_g4_i1.p1  ORF type:complete len:1093 (+),score=361.27 TRINITY_DN6336_c0_g4_i1:33-3281(+)